ncbi:uncharacterized protein LOC111873767 [Cryptotermes secundus]|uniref:uncharacterized protein LOC111873767 n=1 Tax=Cryptotermes secundus TaxID=105785 RepID=UPI000CD7DD64|nr:uncharacterized protein LOC111873767 [Cryptotermes secundus]
MESFNSWMVFPVGLHAMLSDKLVDIVGELPEEIGIMIIRMLDSRTLLSAAVVSKKWRNLCHADSRLQKKIMQQIMFQGVAQYLNPHKISIQRRDPNNYCPSSTMNGHHRMTVAPVSNTDRPRLPRMWAPTDWQFTVPAAEQPNETTQRKGFSKAGKSSSTAKRDAHRNSPEWKWNQIF